MQCRGWMSEARVNQEANNNKTHTTEEKQREQQQQQQQKEWQKAQNGKKSQEKTIHCGFVLNTMAMISLIITANAGKSAQSKENGMSKRHTHTQKKSCEQIMHNS